MGNQDAGGDSVLERGSTDPTDPTEAAESGMDTEGHSLAHLLAMKELSGRPGTRSRDRAPSDDALPPLTRKFPNMREDRRR
jgi:hypothetical protein